MAIRPDDLTPTIPPPNPNPKKPRHHAAAARLRFAFPRIRAASRNFPMRRTGRSRRPTRPRKICSACTNSSASSAACSCNRPATAAIMRRWSICSPPARAAIAASRCSSRRRRQAEVERLDDAGVRGVRLHFYFPHLGQPRAARRHAQNDRAGRAERLACRHSLSAATALSSTMNSSPRSRRRW